jgi:SAM-dependent methyltransferase
MPAAATVTDRHVAVPVEVVDPVVVTFDGCYVWSFSPRRDGTRTSGTWEVAWPPVMHPLLDGTTHVRLGDVEGEQVLFEGDVAFRGSSDHLALRDGQGHPLAVDRAGHLTRVFAETDDDLKRFIAEGTARALRDLRDHVGIDAHISYGCLLGAVRDGRMIGHDTDTDLAYLSAFTHPADIIRESYRMERELRRLGWKVTRMSGADLKLFLPLPDGRDVQIDVFGSFHVGETFYQMGGRSGTLPRAALTPASTVTLEGVELPAPADPEQVLAFLYGPGWPVPDPAFQNVDPVVGLQRLGAWFGGARRELPRWNQLLRDRRAEIPQRGSPFAVWVAGRIPEGARVVDLGCGTGRDTRWFLRQGFTVAAADHSSVARRYTRSMMERHDVRPDVRSLALNDLRSALLTGAELARLPEAPYLYARGLLGCLDREARGNLWVLCAMALRRGGSLHVEYAARRPGLPLAQLDGLVRRIGTRALVREVEAAGGRVVHTEHGPGRDLFGQEDPHLARLEIRWDHARPRRPTGGEPVFKDSVEEIPPTQRRPWTEKAMSLPAVVMDLKSSVRENRRLNRRIAELTDVVAELLVPLADRDEQRARELLEDYRRTTLGS